MIPSHDVKTVYVPYCSVVSSRVYKGIVMNCIPFCSMFDMVNQMAALAGSLKFLYFGITVNIYSPTGIMIEIQF